VQIRRERLRKTLDAPSWRDCLETARGYARNMEFEKGIDCCLIYLHERLVPPPELLDNAELVDNLKIVFACGGNASRWDDFLGIPKQLVDTGDGLPLIQRSINQFKSKMIGPSFELLTQRRYLNQFEFIEGADIVCRQESRNRCVGIEVLNFTSRDYPDDIDILWVYGDVYFSDSAIETITERLRVDRSNLQVFGRKRKNEAYGNTGGEDFAVYVPSNLRGYLREYYAFLQRVYIGTPLHRCSVWELISLISFLRRDTGEEFPSVNQYQSCIDRCYTELVNTLHSKDFVDDLWTEINDETEDFDFPCEYIERIYRMVAWVGQSLEKGFE
jgi:hypothetical protein